jgi:hypothetical protein
MAVGARILLGSPGRGTVYRSNWAVRVARYLSCHRLHLRVKSAVVGVPDGDAVLDIKLTGRGRGGRPIEACQPGAA